MQDRDNEYSTERVAELFGSYIRLKRKVKDLSVDELGKSKDYRLLLQIEHNLRSLTLTGEELMEMGDFTDLIVSNDDIRISSVYQEMLKEQQEAYSQLVNHFTYLKERNSKLKSGLEEALKPFSSLLELLKR